ncbi:MAG: UDP-N-acetylmuramate dehydrogenase [Eubacteriales bacterium]
MKKFEQFALSLLEEIPDLQLKSNETLSRYTSFQIGGPCPLLAFPKNESQFLACLSLAQKEKIPTVILGNGSNLLIADEGYQAFFIQTKGVNEISITPQGIKAEAGCSLRQIANFALTQERGGLSFAQGIPGTVGGAVVMNAGAYGGEIKDVVTSVTSFSWETGEIITRPTEQLDFSYRHSLFSHNNEVVLCAEFALPLGNPDEIKKEMTHYARQRKEKQPVEFPSGGSTFRRPEGHFAAALIDQCGLKGLQIGKAQVSPKHAGFVVNLGGASCQDVLALVADIQHTVKEKTGVTLELEVKVLQ